MNTLSSRPAGFFRIALSLAFFCATALSAQTIDNLYLGRWQNYTAGNPAKPDSNYTLVDTIIQMTFRKDGTYNITGFIKTDVFTPGKGNLRFKKQFRYIEGRYEIIDDQLELLTMKPADANLCTLYAFEGVANKFKQVNPYYRLWDTRSFFEYESVSDFKHSDDFYSRKRRQQTLYTVSSSGSIKDSIAFWYKSPFCAHESQWPKPDLIKAHVHLKNNTFGAMDNWTEDYDKIYIFDSTHRLIRYYYVFKKSESFYYDITYTDSLNEYNTTMKMITDSRDGSRYIFVRDEKDCLLRIEHYDAEMKLIEKFFCR